MTTHDNPELQRAWQIIESTGTNLFLTGKAGTGKTTFLRKLKELSPKRMIVVAPTGIAAINANGMTIHSFFQLPLAPFIPETTFNTKQNHYRFSKQKIDIIRSIDLLVIDEISMVRADLLDAIDSVLRQYRKNSNPFGGVQLLLIGDLQQLAPVVKDSEQELLSQYYETTYFFGSHALRKTDYVTIELKTVYRQSDSRFLSILNKVRENKVDRQTLEELNKRYVPDISLYDDRKYIRLTTHNRQAQETNNRKLDELPGKAFTFKATIEDDFPEYSYPTDMIITLKKGAQVMFVKNDTSGEKRYYNGMLGEVCEINDKGFSVKSKDTGDIIEVGLEEWANCKYALDKDTKEITEIVEGVFRQYPVKLAWAITIHKSQGLTFSHAIIDIQNSFAHGQTYVALSRCKSLEGLVLSSPISVHAIINDSSIKTFTDEMEKRTPGEDDFLIMQRQYYVRLLDDLFGFHDIYSALDTITRLLNGHFVKNYPLLANKYREQTVVFHNVITDVARKFHLQYEQMATACENYSENQTIAERINKGALYFLKNIRPLEDFIRQTNVETGNKELRKRYTEAMNNLRGCLRIKTRLLEYVTEYGFSITAYLKQKAVITLGQEDNGNKKEKKEKKPKIKKIPTREISLKLYKEGKSIYEIAKERSLTAGTILGHLGKYIETGEVRADELVPKEHIERIVHFLRGKNPEDLSYREIRDGIGEDIQYNEIQIVSDAILSGHI
ncbi:helix-turn-helix domain-containing protein [Xylanibacter muris]|uniref:AAA family ATPase n=1 Tax=Xylanibacter muris TaxID=2736290 RepID=A0ABX2AS57_9BACT|nr:helix-turn-helix domain-containing protein [Xylanibacter muris]NPD92786.1 AAA family ATPase [Xylanibacter muris]